MEGQKTSSKPVTKVTRQGGSKGCNTCRRRKKGCDLRRPFCLRCLTDGQACEGYQRAATFVQHQPDVSKGSIRLKQTRSKPQSDSQSDRAVAAGVVLHPSLASSAFGQQCASFWWDAYVPKKDVIASQRYFTTPTPQQLWCNAWIDAITRMSTTSTVLRKALYALSLSCASCQRHDEKLVRQGLQYYSEALVELGQALQTPESVVEDGSLLPTCLLLADFEFFNGFYLPGQYQRLGSWQVHVEGLTHLLQMKGPWKYRSTDAAAVFEAYRRVQLSVCFITGKACSTEMFDWFEISQSDQQQSPRERLRDIMMSLPSLLKSAHATQSLDFEQTQQLFRSLLLVYQQLRNWKAGFEFQLLGDDQRPSPQLLMTFGIDAVHPYLLYWSLSIAIHAAIQKLHSELVDEPDTDRVHQWSNLLDPDATVKNIFAFASFLLRPEAGLVGFTNVCLPLSVLFRYGISGSDEARDEAKLMFEDLTGVLRLGPCGPVLEKILRRMFSRVLPV